MTWRRLAGAVALLACCGTIAACGSTRRRRPTTATGSDATAGRRPRRQGESKTGEQSEVLRAGRLRQAARAAFGDAEGPADKPWEQMIEPEMVDTSEFKSDKADGWNVCFSNAANDNPWRQNGLHHDEGRGRQHAQEIGKFTVVDAEAKDDKQISDIESHDVGRQVRRASSSRRTPRRR